jgi:hypothetical protein
LLCKSVFCKSLTGVSWPGAPTPSRSHRESHGMLRRSPCSVNQSCDWAFCRILAHRLPHRACLVHAHSPTVPVQFRSGVRFRARGHSGCSNFNLKTAPSSLPPWTVPVCHVTVAGQVGGRRFGGQQNGTFATVDTSGLRVPCACCQCLRISPPSARARATGPGTGWPAAFI